MATGTWTFSLSGSPTGTLTFDQKPVQAFGHTFDLGASVGSMPYSGAVTNFNGSAGTLTLNASSPLLFFFSGDFVCPAAGCASSDPVHVFALASLFTGAGLPTGIQWRFTSDDLIWNQALAQNATLLGQRAAAMAQSLGIGVEIDWEENAPTEAQLAREVAAALQP